MLERIEKLLNEPHTVTLTNWERNFLSSIHQQAAAGREFSPAQLNVLERIEKQNSQEQRDIMEEWLSKWDSERAEIAKVVANYYYSVGHYFQKLCRKVLFENKPLSPNEYKKLCENRFATKVIEEHFKAPKFQSQEIVQLRSNITANRHYYVENGGVMVKIQNMHAIVLETDALPVKRAAMGAKVYKVLPFGSPKSYYVSESDLKKSRKIKK